MRQVSSPGSLNAPRRVLLVAAAGQAGSLCPVSSGLAETVCAGSLPAAWEALALTPTPFDAVVSSAALPGAPRAGLRLASELRRSGWTGPVLLLVQATQGRGMRYHAARLHLHTLPLPTDEVNFRAQLVALLWPPPAPEPVIHRCGQLQLNPDEFSVLCRGVQVYPTRREFELLLTLIRQPGHVFSTLELHALLWRGEQVGLNVVRQTVRRIRKRLLPEIIETTPGGYQLRRCS